MAVKDQGALAPEAWIWIDGELHFGPSHWRIVDKLYHGDLAEWLYDSQTKPMLSGWAVRTGDYDAEGKPEVILEIFTEFAPQHQPRDEQASLLIPTVVDKFQEVATVIDIETPDPPENELGILERFTPQGIQTTLDKPLEYKMYKPRSQPDREGDEVGVGDYQVTVFKSDRVGDATIETYDLRAIPGAEYLTVVDGSEMDGYTYSSPTSDTALHAHQETVNMVQMIQEGNQLAAEVDKSELESYPESWGVTKPSPNEPGTWSWDASRQEWNKIAGINIDPAQLTLFDIQGMGVIPVDPPEGTGHEDQEKPFLYYKDGDVLFETTGYTHHADVFPLICKWIEDHTGAYPNIAPGSWINGDITSPEATGRNWIKFIDSGPIPAKLVSYFKGKYPDREVMYSGYDGWEPLPPELIT